MEVIAEAIVLALVLAVSGVVFAMPQGAPSSTAWVEEIGRLVPGLRARGVRYASVTFSADKDTRKVVLGQVEFDGSPARGALSRAFGHAARDAVVASRPHWQDPQYRCTIEGYRGSVMVEVATGDVDVTVTTRYEERDTAYWRVTNSSGACAHRFE